ncbi:hypothetical protein AGMMS50222_01830 [Endomicrobiia bacterium]|nr:hypothetical protein AGMMS49531_02530 [Endomicrobiia bacterium]GHT63605.1 hypothetical protein AGMMS49556_00360 [Endomicrobiia bacterium]GHT73771.1 hypothetical protein AGMMS50222_01830 [Endomicrobiia bacterium]
MEGFGYKQYREAFAKAVEACRQAHEVSSGYCYVQVYTNRINRKQEHWDWGMMLGKLL